MTRKRDREGKEDEEVKRAKPDTCNALVEKVLEKIDATELATNLAPSLAGRLLWTINMEELTQRVFDTLVERVAGNDKLMDEVSAQIVKQMEKGRET